jgi:hypothetical protein
VQSHTLIIRSLKVGDMFVENVRGSIAPTEGSLLLGQSFLERFRPWSVEQYESRIFSQTTVRPVENLDQSQKSEVAGSHERTFECLSWSYAETTIVKFEQSSATAL